jgi:hypothetical protein
MEVVEGEEEEHRWEACLQARAGKENAACKKRKEKQTIARHSTRLTKITKVGRGQREMEVLKLRTAVQVQRLRSAGSGKGTPEDDKVRS